MYGMRYEHPRLTDAAADSGYERLAKLFEKELVTASKLELAIKYIIKKP